MTTILTEIGSTDVASAKPAGDSLWLSAADVERATGWTMKPEGLCQGDICVPAPGDKSKEFVRDDTVNIAAFWKLMDRPVVHDTAGETWMLGRSAGERANALQSLQAPDFTLPDLDGKLHTLSDYRGNRVFLTTWSSW